jgi:hypothetical protein
MFQTLMTCVNIIYSVFEHDPDKNKANIICWLIQGKLAQYLAPAKIIVYSRTIKRITELSQVLDYYKYYCKVGDCEKKEKIIKQ